MQRSRRTLETRPGRRRRGFTIMELMIAAAISSLVMVAVAGVEYVSARAIKELYGETRTRSSRMQSLDQIRYRLVEARVGSVSVSQLNDAGTGYNRIEFVDPNLGGSTSAFFFALETNTLFYDDDLGDGNAATPVVKGPIDIYFNVQSAGAMVKLSVKSASNMAYADIDVQDGETLVYLRNI